MTPTTFSIAVQIPSDPGDLKQLLQQFQTFVSADERIQELFLLNGQRFRSLRIDNEELENLKDVKVINCSSLGEELQEAANTAQGEYLITITGLEISNTQLLKAWLAEIPTETSQETDITGQNILALFEKQADGNKPVQPKRNNLSWYKALTTLRTDAAFSPVKLYPTDLARYLYNKTPVHSPCFEVESLHRAEMEGAQVTKRLIDKHSEQSSQLKPGYTKWQALKRAMAFKYNYQIVEPLKVTFRKDQISQPKYLANPQYWSRFLFTILLVFLMFLMPILSIDHGATYDEEFHEERAKKLVDYYLTLGEDKSAIYYRSIKFYGGLFDTYSGFIVKHLNPLFEEDYTFEIRHMFNALIGFLGILFTGLLGKYLGGWRGGLLAILFLALSPRFLGHSMNNPKDIPFAAAFIMGVYFMIKTVREFPYTTKRAVFWLIFAIACAISIRIGGLLLINYFGLFIIIYVLNEYFVNGNTPISKFHLKRGFWLCLIVTILGYFGGLVFWPYGLRGPIEHPFDALTKMSDYSNLITTWFGGEVMKSDQLPWYYIFKYLVMTSPLFVIAGFGILIGWSIYRVSKQLRSEYLMILFTVFFPIGFIIVKGSNLYDGIRQLLFIYPSLIVVTSQAWLYLLNTLSHRIVRIGFLAVLTVLLILPLAFIARNHPHEYVYYNQLVGGVQGAYGKYELDYYGNASKEAIEFLGPYIKKNHPKDSTVQVKTNYLEPDKNALRQYHPNIRFHKSKFDWMDEKGWDYGLLIARWFPLDYIENGKWPPQNTIHKITVDGVPIMVITKNQN